MYDVYAIQILFHDEFSFMENFQNNFEANISPNTNPLHQLHPSPSMNKMNFAVNKYYLRLKKGS